MRDTIKASLIHYLVAGNSTYIPTRLHTFLCDIVQRRIERGSTRLAISVPPRHGKSEMVSKGLPAWYLGHNPTAEIMEICHSADLATEFGSDVRAMMASPFYGALFPDSVPTGEGKAGGKWRTISGGKYKGEGVDGSFTGFGANLLIVDDIVKNRKQAHSLTFQKGIRDTFGSTIFTRLLPESNIIILNTRWTSNDLVGYVANELGFEYINLPAIAFNDEEDPLGRLPGEPLCPERYSLEALLEIKRTMSNPYDWEALYQGRPPDEVKPGSFGKTPEGLKPNTGVWFGDRVLLFAHNACTALGAAETLTELQDWLWNHHALDIPVYCAETGIVTHPYTKEILPNLKYHPDLEGFFPPVTITFPSSVVSPRDVAAARYYLTLPSGNDNGYIKGRLALGMISGQSRDMDIKGSSRGY